MQSGYYRQQGKQVTGFSKKSERDEKSVIEHKDQETTTFCSCHWGTTAWKMIPLDSLYQEPRKQD